MEFPSPFKVSEIKSCDELWQALESFRAPHTVSEQWVFRGTTSCQFGLKPSIEVKTPSTEVKTPFTKRWIDLEEQLVAEYQARAPLYLRDQPTPSTRLDWLSQMQHYGIPTRLLDFSYSPWIALYFCVRAQKPEDPGPPLRLWAIDINQLHDRAVELAEDFDIAGTLGTRLWSSKRRGPWPMLDPRNFRDPNDDRADMQRLVTQLLEGPVRIVNETGFVYALRPSAFNPRLANQQGLFLVNCAAHITFEQSLRQMIKDYSDRGWYKVFHLPRKLATEIEGRLYQMNIHEQSLFPDLSGLAGLLKQRIRLHWS